MTNSRRVILVAVGILVGAFLLKSGIVAFAGYVLLGVYLLGRRLALIWTNNLAATREAPSGPFIVGESVDVSVKIKNLGSIPIGWSLVEEMLPEAFLRCRPPRLTLKGRCIRLLMIPPRATRTLKYKLTFATRGYFPIGPCVAETGDVFGLHRRHRILVAPHYVMVLPKIVPLRKYQFASERPIGEIRLANRLFEDPTRTAGVRPYQMGDPLQRVHWRATARTGLLHSRIYEPTSLAGATILVDFHESGYPKRTEPFRSDLVITTACALAYAVSLLNQQVGLASNGLDAAERIRLESLELSSDDEEFTSRQGAREQFELVENSKRLRPVKVDTRRGFDQFQQIRETLARLEPTAGSDFADMVFEVAPRLPKDATLICLLPQVPVKTAIALGMLRRQGFAVSAILIGMADDGSDDRVRATGRLIAEGIRDVRHLNDERDLVNLGEAGAAPADYGFQTSLV